MRMVLEPHARTVRIGIAAQHAHQSRAVRSAVAHADTRGKCLARAMREAIEITGDRQLCFGHVVRLAGADRRCQAGSVARTLSNYCHPPAKPVLAKAGAGTRRPRSPLSR